MNRKEWQERYQISEVDMEFIDACIKSPCAICLPDAICKHQRSKIAEVENPPLNYEDIRIEIRK